MQVCPFCNYDRNDRPLDEGRCPNCGIVLDWQEIEPSPTDTIQLPQPQNLFSVESQNRHESLGSTSQWSQADWKGPEATPASDQVKSESLIQDHPSPETNEPLRDSDSDARPKLQRDSNSDSNQEKVAEIWRASISEGIGPQHTLKGAVSAATVSDSIFSIQQREIRSGEVDVGVPVDYQLLEVIGQGGVGVVYSARQSSIDRTVAIKMLREEYRTRNDHRDKFLAEAVVTGELDHPNIVPIYDLGRSVQGELFYSMKNVVGTPWDRVIGQKPQRENLEILMKVADAVAFAHSRGVVHRDLKPENVMLGSFGEVLVMDWGIALPTEGFRKNSSILRTQAMGGTPAYMAPEMATGPIENIGPGADIYLLGAILFEILTGVPPHFGKDVMDCVLNASKNVIQETDVTGELMDVALLAMSTLVRRRYRSVQDFQNAIRLYQSHIESITLSDNAERDLLEATTKNDYQELSRIVFAFREALSLWEENSSAEEGLARAQLAYASAALEKGDFDLGLSILSKESPEHGPLIRKLEAAQKDRAAKQLRFQAIRKLAVGLVGFILIAGSIAMFAILGLYRSVSEKNSELSDQAERLKEAKSLAEGNEEEAVKAKTKAVKEQKNALKQKDLAEQRRRDAELARLESIAQRMRAEESSYSAELGLVSASIEQNGFAVAADVLEKQLRSPSKSKLRHWEWGRNWFLVRGATEEENDPAVRTHKREDLVVSIDANRDGSLIAVGLANGFFEVWSLGNGQPIARIRHGKKLNQLDVSANGQWLATCGSDDDQGSIKIWRLHATLPPTMEQSIVLKGSNVETVALSNEDTPSFVIGSDRQRIGRIWRWSDGVETAVLLGHVESITSVMFSPNSQFVATSSLDGSVRIWNSQTGKQVQRFSEHQAPVMTVAFAPNGNKVASGGADRRILVWDLQTDDNLEKELLLTQRQVEGEKVDPPKFQTFQGHTGTVRCIRFSEDGQAMASTANDNLICVWEVEPSQSNSSMLKELRRSAPTSIQPGEPLARLRGHGGWVNSCSLLSDGGTLISGSDDSTWKVWKLLQFRERQKLGNGQVQILDARFSPDGKTVATAHLDGTIELWDVANGKGISVLKEGHEYLTNKARFASNGKRLVTAAGDNTIRLWNVETGSQFAVLERAGRNAVFSLSADSRWLVSSGDETGVVVWDLNDLEVEPKRFRPWKKETDPQSGDVAEPTSLAISRNGDLVFLGNKNGSCEFWNVSTGQLLHQAFGHAETIVASYFLDSNEKNENGTTVLTASEDGSVAWWNATTGEEHSKERLRNFLPIQRAAISPDGRFLVCGSSLTQGDSRLWIWNLETGEKIRERDLKKELIQDISFVSSEENAVFVTIAGFEDSRKSIQRWDPARDLWKSVGNNAMRTGSLWGSVPTDDGMSLLTYGGRGAKLWRLSDLAEVMSYRPSTAIRTIAFSPSGQELAAGSQNGTIVLWNPKDSTSQRKLIGGHIQAVNDLVFSPDGKRLVSTASDGRVAVWDVKEGKLLTKGRMTDRVISGNAVRFFPDGQFLLVAAEDQTFRVFDVQTLKMVRKWKGHNGPITSLAISPDGRWIASGGEDKTIRLWSSSTGEEFTSLLGHSAPIESLAFSADGLRLLTASRDTKVKLWDVDRLMMLDPTKSFNDDARTENDFAEMLSLDFHSSEAMVAEFSPDGDTILTAGLDGYAALWPSQRIAPALRMSTPNVTYRSQEGFVRLDPLAVINLPSARSLAGGSLQLGVDSNSGEPLTFRIDSSEGRFTVVDSKIYVRSTTSPKNEQSSQGLCVGAIETLQPGNLSIRFENSVTQPIAQELLRSIAFHWQDSEERTELRQVAVQLSITDSQGSSGNFKNEQILISEISD